MRPRAFPHIPAGGWVGDYAKSSDEALPAGVVRLVQTYRTLLMQDHAKAGDVTATLQRLAAMTREEAADRLHDLDTSTEAELETAALAMTRTYDLAGADIPALAAHALAHRSRATGGRPATERLAQMFATDLARHWWNENGTIPRVSIQDLPATDYQLWALDLLQAAGFSTGNAYNILRIGIQQAREAGTLQD